MSVKLKSLIRREERKLRASENRCWGEYLDLTETV